MGLAPAIYKGLKEIEDGGARTEELRKRLKAKGARACVGWVVDWSVYDGGRTEIEGFLTSHTVYGTGAVFDIVPSVEQIKKAEAEWCVLRFATVCFFFVYTHVSSSVVAHTTAIHTFRNNYRLLKKDLEGIDTSLIIEGSRRRGAAPAPAPAPAAPASAEKGKKAKAGAADSSSEDEMEL